MARDRGGPPLVFQLLVYPVTDNNSRYKSYDENSGNTSSREKHDWGWNHYIRDESDATNPYAAPMQAKDLSGLPPALLITAEYNTLRDEGEAYAQRLKQADVPTIYTCYEGMIHHFIVFPSLIDKGKEATEQMCAALKEAFSL